jgi:hypothetical protein
MPSLPNMESWELASGMKRPRGYLGICTIDVPGPSTTSVGSTIERAVSLVHGCTWPHAGQRTWLPFSTSSLNISEFTKMPVNTISPVLGHRITSVKLMAHPNTNASLQSCRIGSHGQDHASSMHYNMCGIARACRRFPPTTGLFKVSGLRSRRAH